jgi:hypothetical protein
LRAEEKTWIAATAGPRLNLRRALGGLSLILALCLFVDAGTAAAEDVHTISSGEYGKEAVASSGTGSSCRITYQEAEKRLYLMSDGKIYGIEITSPGTAVELPGYPIEPGLGSSFYCSTTDIQVDNTNGSSKGRYYTTVGGSEITAFNPNGTKVASPWPALSTSLCSTAVLPNGDVWGYSQFPQPPTISRFTSAGEPLKSIPFTEVGCPQMAIDPVTLDLYVANYSTLLRYTAASEYKSFTAIAPASQYRDYVVNGALKKVYIATGSGFEAYSTEDGEWLETVSIAGGVNSLALDEGTDTIFAEVGSQAGGRIQEYAPHVVPNTTTGSATEEGLVSGTVEALSNGPVTSCVVEYGLGAKKRNEAYEHSVPCSPATPYAEGSTTPITAQLTGLIGETLYHYRVVVANATGKGYGKDRTFTPHYVQAVLTEACSALTTSGVTLNASFNGNGEDTHYFFEWGLNGNEYEHTTPSTDAGSPTGYTAVSAPITGLTSDTEYHYRVVMSNPKGSSPGNDVECSSEHAVHSLVTEAVSNLTSTSATLNGSWNGNGEDTHFFFEWGFNTGSGFEHSTPMPVGDGGSTMGTQVHSAPLSGLVSNATYRYRIIASDSKGTSTGETLTFKTFQFPSIQYQQPSELTPTSVTLNALVNPNEGGATTFHFDYGLTSAYGSNTPESASVGSDSTFHQASQTITGLEPGTTYYYRIVATGPGGPYEGEEPQTFTTVPISPTIGGVSVSEQSPTTAKVSAEVQPGFGATVVFFEYGLSSSYGASTIPGAPLAADNDPHQVSAVLEGLKPESTYHYKVYAINFGGSTTTSDLTFTTAGQPRVDGESASAVTETSATVSAQINPNFAPTTYHVEYGPTNAYGMSTAESGSVGADNSNHGITGSLSGLTPGTTYYYRVVATNAVGSTAGEESTFTTAATPKTEKPKPKPKHCRKGFVRRHGKCVKKRTKKKKSNHHTKRHHHRRGSGAASS